MGCDAVSPGGAKPAEARLAARYDPSRAEVQQLLHERSGAIDDLLSEQGWNDRQVRRVLELGCGAGGNLSAMLRLGFAAERMAGIDLQAARIQSARAVLPATVNLQVGDALKAPWPAGSMDLVMLFTVLSSLPDPHARAAMAHTAWRLVRPLGAVLCYDFAWPSPANPDVRRVAVRELRRLFPEGELAAVRRLTLAQPLARGLARVHPALIDMTARWALLRTHRLVWIRKPENAA